MIRIFIGCSANNEDLEFQAVLDYTLRKHASEPVEITWMKLSKDSASFWYSDAGKGWNTKSWATPFSPFRWAIPAFCKFEGRAIYLDIDMVCLADIAGLWNQQFKPGAVVLAKGKGKAFCCSLFDCAAIKPHMPDIDKLRRDPMVYRELRKTFDRDPKLVQPFAGNWNCLDGESYASLADPDIKILHYTAIPSQPHLPYAIPRLAAQGKKHWHSGGVRKHQRADAQALFDGLLKEAISNGFAPENYATAEIFGDYGR